MTVKLYYKNFLTMLSGNFVSQLIPFIVAPFLTRLLSPEDFAVMAIFVGIASMMGIVASGRLEFAIPILKDKQTARNIAFTGLLITVLVTLLSGLFPVFSKYVVQFYNNQEIEAYLWMMPLAVASIGLYNVISNWVLRLKWYKWLSLGNVTHSLVNNGVAILLGYWGWGAEGLIIGWMMGQLISILFLVLVIDNRIELHHYSLSLAKKTIWEFKDFPLINSLHAFTDILVMQPILFAIITSFFGLEELGFFVIMNKYVRAPMRLISSSVSQLFYSEAADAKNKLQCILPIWRRTIFISLLFSVPFIIILLLLGPELFEWYLGSDWKQAGVYAQYIVFSLLCSFLVSPISGITIIFNKQKRAYVYVMIGYTVTLFSLIVPASFGWKFEDTLLIYSFTFGIFQIALMIWYYSLLKRHHESIG